jgi:hypothetical protein
LAAGFCLHDAQGKQVAAFESKVTHMVQTVCTPKSDPRKLLKGGCLVLECVFVGQPSFFFHIGAANLTNGDWRLGLLPLTKFSGNSHHAVLKAPQLKS